MKATEQMVNALKEMGLANEWHKGTMNRLYIDITKAYEMYSDMDADQKRHGNLPLNRRERDNGKIWIDLDTLDICTKGISLNMGDEEAIVEALEDLTKPVEEPETVEAETVETIEETETVKAIETETVESTEPVKVCKICGAPLPQKRRSYCSDACAAEGAKRNQRVKVKKERTPSPIYTERACQDCGKVMLLHIRSIRCPECQREANRAAGRLCKQRQGQGLTRKIGSTDLCQRCGQPYTVTGGLQRYCKACAPLALADNDRAVSRELARKNLTDAVYRSTRNAKRRNADFAHALRTCPVCGKQFKPTHGRRLACSPECSTIQRARNDKRYRAINADRLTAQRKERLARKKETETTKEVTP